MRTPGLDISTLNLLATGTCSCTCGSPTTLTGAPVVRKHGSAPGVLTSWNRSKTSPSSTKLVSTARAEHYPFPRQEAHPRLSITLSDGDPVDVYVYRGPYGIKETRKALTETRHMGIHLYCITIDTDAREYLPGAYGETDFIIIDQVDRLPVRIAYTYRRLTT